MALPAVTTITPNAAAPASQPQAAPANDTDAAFAQLLAMPEKNGNQAKTPNLQKPAAPTQTSGKIGREKSATNKKPDAQIALAVLAVPQAPIAQMKLPLSGPEMKIGSAEPAKQPQPIRELLTQIAGKGQSEAGAAPKNIVSEIADGAMGKQDAKPTAAKSASNTVKTKAEPALIAGAAHDNVKTAPQAQVTKAQALPVQFDAASKNSNPQSGNHGDPSQKQDHPASQSAQSHSQPAHSVPAQPAHAITQSAQNAATPAQIAAPAIAPVQAAAIHAAIQVSQNRAPVEARADIAALAVTIAAKSQEGAKHFEIRLDPPEMGRIDVHLSVDDTGKAQAHLSAEKPQTLTLLKNDSGNLERALKDAGLNLGNNALNFSLRGDQRQATPRGAQKSRTLSVESIAAPASETTIQSHAPGSAMLDIRV